ncbi:MAG: hypothetical protein DI551_08955 [Micavibrio aeruginosavorus]|uniref:Uncharacterized protein n=1 Tax=Micavibrio aeruginosavorus TaxID=349221 RepID=A0A2W5MXN9_9BACT|nr:MAG: hypothetical protein DI551_08955 [Micavibrio aeruginosavorus]
MGYITQQFNEGYDFAKEKLSYVFQNATTAYTMAAVPALGLGGLMLGFAAGPAFALATTGVVTAGLGTLVHPVINSMTEDDYKNGGQSAHILNLGKPGLIGAAAGLLFGAAGGPVLGAAAGATAAALCAPGRTIQLAGIAKRCFDHVFKADGDDKVIKNEIAKPALKENMAALVI